MAEPLYLPSRFGGESSEEQTHAANVRSNERWAEQVISDLDTLTTDVDALPTRLRATATWDPPLVATGNATTTTVTVTGAVVGQPCTVGFSVDINDECFMTAHVESTDTVRVQLFNFTGGNVDLASGTLTVDVWV